MFKKQIQKRLEKYVREYFAVHPEVKLVAVAGSVGKTSTKTAIATVLAKQLRVRMENTNHNTHMSAPLAILGIDYPTNVHSIFAWLTVFRAAKKRIKQPTDVDVIVQELGTDRPGEIAHFMTYLRPNIGVVTSVTPEHMEFFHNIEKVAEEEIALANGSELAIVNREDVAGRFASFLTNQTVVTYGSTSAAEYRIEVDDFSLEYGYAAKLIAPEIEQPLSAQIRVMGEHSLRPVTAAMTVAVKMGITLRSLVAGVEDIAAVKGRMNVLRGVRGSIIIDDTYNSSPASASAALRTLYDLPAPQRIAILGDMNELGSTSPAEHEALGMLCDPNLLAWVITIGKESEAYLAPAARGRGCQVKSFKSAIEAGGFVNSVLDENGLVLAKGSQGDIYAEEAVKVLLHETHEDKELVRQSQNWQTAKRNFFESLS